MAGQPFTMQQHQLAHRLMPRVVALLVSGVACSPSWSQSPAPEVPATRQQALIHIVRQDCGSCHGMTLKGGLGPALTREALAERPMAALVATILQGRTGTPMPGWQGMLDEQDARWVAAQLLRGFPEEARP